MRGKPGQIKIEGDEIGGDGDNYTTEHLEVRDGIVTRYPRPDSDYTNPRANPGNLGFQFRLPPQEGWDWTLTSNPPIITDGTEHILYLKDYLPKGAYGVLLYVRIQDGSAGNEIKFRNAD